MTMKLIIDDPVIERIREVKHRLAEECDFDVHRMAEAIREKSNELALRFGLPIESLEAARTASEGQDSSGATPKKPHGVIQGILTTPINGTVGLDEIKEFPHKP